MKNIAVFGIVCLIAMLLIGLAVAKPDTDRDPTTNQKGNVPLTIPAHAIEVAPEVFYLGQTADIDGTKVEGYMFVHKKNAAKPQPSANNAGISCYSFLASGAKWKVVEPWVVNTANNQNLDGTFVLSNIGANIQKWENAASFNIMGTGSTTSNVLVADQASTDGQNEIYFGSIADPNTIAVTITWGIYSGPIKNRRLVEFDQIYDQDDFAWSSAGEAGKMDFENIATHEIGHGIGMGHPSSSCTEETMYAYASFGETKKRSLNAGDSAGINALY